MTKAESAAVVQMLSTAFPAPAWTPDTLKLYREMLIDLDADAAKAGVMQIIHGRTKPDRPTIGEIRAAVAALLDANKAGGRALEADEAWGFVMQCFTRIGSYQDFPDTHPLVARTVAAMGWREMCASDNPEATRAHFTQFYRALLDRSRRDAAVSAGMSVAIEGPSRPRLSNGGERQGLTHVRDILSDFLPDEPTTH